MLSMCGVICRVLRGWRHQEAVSLMASALAQPDASFLVHDIAALNMGLVQVHEPGGTSSFCQNSTDCSVEYVIWRDNNKQAVVIKPRQCVDLMRWTLFIHLDNLSEEATTPKSHLVEQQSPMGDPNISMNGSSKQQDNCMNKLAVLLEASYYDHGEEFKEDPIMVEHLGQPYAWKARDTFGVIVMTTPTQLLTMVRAFFTNSLIMDDDFIVTKILTVDLVGEASTLSDPTSIPETVTPGPWTRPTSGRTQMEIARSLTPKTSPGRQSPANGEDGLLGSKNLHPVTSTKINPSLLPSIHQSEPPSESEGSNYDMSALCPRAWAFSGYHVVSGQPLPRTLTNFSKTCVMTNPMEELWSDKYYNTMVAADNRINEERDGGITDSDKEKERGTCSIGTQGCLPLCKEDGEVTGPSKCTDDSSSRKESQLSSSKTFMRDEMAKNAKAKVKAQSLKKLHKLSQSQSVELPSPSHSFSFGNENVCLNIITAEPKKYPFRISSDSDLGRATSMIKDNLTNIVENYLIKSRSSKGEIDEAYEKEVFTKSTSLGSIPKAKPISEIKYQSTASDSSLESFLYRPLTSQPESLIGVHESEEEMTDGTRIEMSSPGVLVAQGSDTVSMYSSYADETLHSLDCGQSVSKELGYGTARELMESDDQMTLADFVAQGLISPTSVSECKISQGSDDMSGNPSFDEDFLSTESVLGSSHAEDRILKSAMTLEDVEQSPLDMADDATQEIDVSCDQVYNQEQEVVAGLGSLNKCLLSPVDSVPESGFSSLKEPEVSEVDNCSSYPNVRISKSKDSLDLTDTDKCLPTDTLSDDMETLSSNAGDATLVESGVVSTEGSARGSFSESHNFDANLGHLANNESNSISDFDLIDLSLNFKKQISESTDTLTQFNLSKIDDVSYEAVSSATSDTIKAKKLQPTRSSSSEEPSLAISRSEKDEAICSAMKPSESLSSADTIVSRDHLEDSGSKASSCHDDLMKIVMKESLESQDSFVFDNSPEKDMTIETVLEQENLSAEQKIEVERKNEDTELALVGDSCTDSQGIHKSKTSEPKSMEEGPWKTRDESGTPSLTSVPPVTIETDQCLITVREANSCTGVGDIQESELTGSKNMTGQDAVNLRLLEPVAAPPVSKENASLQGSNHTCEPNEKSPGQDNLSARFDLFGRKFSDCSISELEDKVFLSPDQEVRDLASCIRYGVGMREAYLILDSNKAQKADAISDEKNKEAHLSKVSLQDTKKESIRCTTGFKPDLKVQAENQVEAAANEVCKGETELSQFEEAGSKEYSGNSTGMHKKLIENVEAKHGREEDVGFVPKKELDQELIYNCSGADKDSLPKTGANKIRQTDRNDLGEAAEAIKLQKEAFNTQKCSEASRVPIQLAKDDIGDDPSMRKGLDMKRVEYSKTSGRDYDNIARGTEIHGNKDDKVGALEDVLKAALGETIDKSAQVRDLGKPLITEDKKFVKNDREEVFGKDLSKTTTEIDLNISVAQDMSKTVSEKEEDKGLMKAVGNSSIEKDLDMTLATGKSHLSKTISENEKETSRRRGSCSSKKIKLPKQVEAVQGQEVADECLNPGTGLPKLIRESAVVDEDLENAVTAHSIEEQTETLLAGSEGNKSGSFSNSMVDDNQKRPYQKDKFVKESQCNGKPVGPKISGPFKDYRPKQNSTQSANEPHISTSKNMVPNEPSPVAELKPPSSYQKVEKSKKKSVSSPILNSGSRTKRTPALGVIKAKQSSGTSAESSLSSESKDTSSNSPSLSRVTSSSTDGLGDVWQVTRPRGNTMESSSVKSETGSLKADVLSLKSEGSLDKFPHFDAVTAQVKARGARKKTASLDTESKTSSEKEKLRDSIHRSATLPAGNISPISKKEEKKKEKEERSKKKKEKDKDKDKDKSGSSTEKKSSMLSLKGLLKRNKAKEKDKSKDSSDEKLSSPSIFRKLERKNKSSPKSSKGNENRTTQPAPANVEGIHENGKSHPVSHGSSNGKTRPVISSPVNLCKVAGVAELGVATSICRSNVGVEKPHSGSESESPSSSLQSSPRRLAAHTRKASIGTQQSPRLYRHVLTRNLSGSQESLESPQLSSQSSPYSSPHVSPKRVIIPPSASSYSLPACRDVSPPAPLMGTRALKGSNNSVSITIGFKPKVEKHSRSMSEGVDIHHEFYSPAFKRREKSHILTQLNKRSSSMEILVCGKIREHFPDRRRSHGSGYSREGSFRLHREISVETLLELPEISPKPSRTQQEYQEYLSRVQARNDSQYNSSTSLNENEAEAEAPREHSSLSKKLSLPHSMHLSGMSEVSSSNPNLCRSASPFVRGMPHSSSFTASPYRRPHSSTSYASPAKRPYVMAAGGLPSGGEPGTPLKSVKEEEYVACRKNVDTDLEKPPNVLIYAANKVEYFESVKDTLNQCLNPDRYTLYHLTDEIAFKSPWLSSTTLLIVCGDVPAHVSTSFIRYLLMGGRVLSICSDFLNVAIPLFGTVEVQEEAVVSMSYRKWPSVQLLHHQHCFHSSPKNKRFSCNLEHKKEQNKSAVSVEPTHVEIRDEYGHHHRLDLRVLATDDTWGAPSLLAAAVAINKGKAIFSQVHLERDPRECGSEIKDKKKLEASNNARLEILRDLLSNELNLDVSSVPAYNFGPAYFLGTHELQKGMLQKLEPHMVGKELKRPDLTMRFLSIKEKPGVATEDKMPVIMNACPRNFSTVKYFETLKTSWLGRLVLYSDVMVSSMQVTKGHPPLSHGLVVVPNQQTGGKGRGGNAWLSPLGCAMFTVHLHIALASNLGQHITFLQHLVAMAVVRALRHLPGYQDIPMRLKWPNDIYFDSETKIGGVIVDSSTVGKEVIVNAGCGVNLSNSNPTVCINDLICQYNEEHGTNLKEIDRETFLALVFNQLEDLINTFQSRGPEAVVPDYYQWWLHGNQSVVVQDVKGQTQPAIITGIDNFGFLEARLESGPVISLQPDGNSFDMMQGLIYIKMH